MFIFVLYRFKDSVAKNRYWPVEIFRLPQPSGSKSKKVLIQAELVLVLVAFVEYTHQGIFV